MSRFNALMRTTRGRLAAGLLTLIAVAAGLVTVLSGGEEEQDGFQGKRPVPLGLPPGVGTDQLRGLGLPTGPRSMEVVIQDDALLLHRPETLDDSLAKIVALGFNRVRLTAGWSVLTRDPDATTKPEFDATDPAAYEQDKWFNLDRAVRKAQAAGLKVMIDVAFWAPRWATTDTEAGRARTNINVDMLRDFALAVVKRYGGDFQPRPPKPGVVSKPSSDGNFLQGLLGGRKSAAPPPAPVEQPLPKVTMYTVWNEPNHQGFVMPQWHKQRGTFVPASPGIYRRMLYATVPAIKQQMPDSTVLVGGTSSTGSTTPGRGAVQPLLFMRRLACVNDAYKPITTGECAGFQKIPGDGWSHHPYSLSTVPGARNDKRHPDNAPIGELNRMTSQLDRLVAAGRFDAEVANVYLTEYGYETNPPDSDEPFSTGDQVRNLAWAEYLAWKNPRVKMFPQFLLNDLPPREAGPATGSTKRPFGDWQSGLYFADGSPKLAAESFASPTFSQAVRGPDGTRVVMVWGRLRSPGGIADVRIESLRGGAWQALTSATKVETRARASQVGEVAFPTSTDGVFLRFVPAARGVRYRVSYLAGGKLVNGAVLSPAAGPAKALRR